MMLSSPHGYYFTLIIIKLVILTPINDRGKVRHLLEYVGSYKYHDMYGTTTTYVSL